MATIGAPFTETAKKVMLSGSGELGEEVVIELQRCGVEVIACDAYENAPAMKGVDRPQVFSILDGAALRRVNEEEKPAVAGKRCKRKGGKLGRAESVGKAREKARGVIAGRETRL